MSTYISRLFLFWHVVLVSIINLNLQATLLHLASKYLQIWVFSPNTDIQDSCKSIRQTDTLKYPGYSLSWISVLETLRFIPFGFWGKKIVSWTWVKGEEEMCALLEIQRHFVKCKRRSKKKLSTIWICIAFTYVVPHKGSLFARIARFKGKCTVLPGAGKGVIRMKFLQTASTTKLLVSFEGIMYR